MTTLGRSLPHKGSPKIATWEAEDLLADDYSGHLLPKVPDTSLADEPPPFTPSSDDHINLDMTDIGERLTADEFQLHGHGDGELASSKVSKVVGWRSGSRCGDCG